MVRSDFFVLFVLAAMVAVLLQEHSRLSRTARCSPLAFSPSSPPSLRSRDTVRSSASPPSLAACPIRSAFPYMWGGGWRCAVGGMGCIFSSIARSQLYGAVAPVFARTGVPSFSGQRRCGSVVVSAVAWRSRWAADNQALIFCWDLVGKDGDHFGPAIARRCNSCNLINDAAIWLKHICQIWLHSLIFVSSISYLNSLFSLIKRAYWCCRGRGNVTGIVHSIDIHPSRKHICIVGGSSGTLFAWDLRWQQWPILLSGVCLNGTDQPVSESEVCKVQYDSYTQSSGITSALSTKILPVMVCSEDGILVVLEQGEDPVELLAEPCAINAFDIDPQNPFDVVCALEWESMAILSRGRDAMAIQ
ncbi:uncharacterized protein LOC109723504 [Ananas comosus]|uniref:Uncharacterized protein LOC109723504 n=1 Tax=Ananas comosus TaxID=4615 RepID=A0A6P5GNB3_ANACO|nr:uncharacterized protein LOC109723504 [Ananas comosus]